MEPPASWCALTASLAVSDLADGGAAWAFLVRHALVRNTAGNRETFLRLLREEIDRGAITGPSISQRVASGLGRAGIALPAGDAPDPWANIAAERLAAERHE